MNSNAVGGSAIIDGGSSEMPQTNMKNNNNTLSRAGPSMEDIFLSTRKLGLLESRFKIPRHLTFREKKLLRHRAEQRKAQMDADEATETTLKDSFDDFDAMIRVLAIKQFDNFCYFYYY